MSTPELKLSRDYYYALQKTSVNNFDFDAIYIDFYPKDVWDAEERIPYLFESDIYQEDHNKLHELVLGFNIPKDMVESDSSFSFYILDPENYDNIVTNLKKYSNLIERDLPNTCDTIPDAHKLLYHIQKVPFKPAESGPQETETEQLCAFILPKGLLHAYKHSGNFENVSIINQDNWCSLDHRFSFDMKDKALTKNIAFDLINCDGLLFPCYPEDIEEKLPTDDFCADIDLIKDIFNSCGMEEDEDVERLSDIIITQISLDRSLS